MLLIVGLGNPGDKYRNNRHNFGFIAIDAISNYYKVNFSNKFRGLYGIYNKIIFIKPETFMNCSGESVIEIVNYFNISVNKILVFHDELELDFGINKLKFAGSDKGHNGLRSISKCIGNNYHRMQLGIGRPNCSDISNYVLSNFNKEEMKQINLINTNLINDFPNLVQTLLDSNLEI